MAEMETTKKGRDGITKLLKALGQDEKLRIRFERDARGVMDEFGLGDLVPEGADLQVEVEVARRGTSGTPKPTHLDSPHVDQSQPFPDPLPPGHLDLSHTDAVLAPGKPLPPTVIRVRGVAGR